MTTEPRKLDELLALDTYQGMSDAEIELVIEHRAAQLHADDAYREERAAYETLVASLTERNQNAKIASDTVLRNAFAAARIQAIEVTPKSVALEEVAPHVEEG